jgi:hypothetical protein
MMCIFCLKDFRNCKCGTFHGGEKLGEVFFYLLDNLPVKKISSDGLIGDLKDSPPTNWDGK